MKHLLDIPRWRPTTTNELLSAHWSKAAKMKKADANTMWKSVLENRIPTALKKRRIVINIKMKPGRGRLIDPDNILKSALDSLKRSRMIIDDSQTWCECAMPIIERGRKDNWGTFIMLEDV